MNMYLINIVIFNICIRYKYRFLWEEVVLPFRYNDCFAFLSPHFLSSVHIKSENQVNYIKSAIERKAHIRNILFLAAYNVG